MAREFAISYRLRSGDVSTPGALAERLNQILEALDLRVAGAEERTASVGELEEALRAYGLDRVNAVLAPVLARIQAAADLGAILTARTDDLVAVGQGERVFVVPPVARQAFAPAQHLSIVQVDDPAIAMLARRVAYDRDTGELRVEVVDHAGAGSHAGWILSAAASIENAGQIRVAPPLPLAAGTLAQVLGQVAALIDEKLPAAAAGPVGLGVLAADDPAQGREALELGSAATQPASNFSSTGHAHSIGQIGGIPSFIRSLLDDTTADVARATLKIDAAIQAKIDTLLGAVPGTLDTLDELAAALGDDANFAATIAGQLAGKAPAVHDHDALYPRLDGVNAGSPGFMRNLLVNGDVSVWQRGAGPFAATGYTADGWRLNAGAGSGNTLSRVASLVPGHRYALSWLRSVLGTATSVIEQRVERGARRYGGREVTFSFWAWAPGGPLAFSANLLCFYGTGGSPTPSEGGAPVEFTATAVPQRYTLTRVLPSSEGKTFGTNDDEYLRVLWQRQVVHPIGDLVISAARLDLGRTAHEAIPTPLGDEVRRCQRFLQVKTVRTENGARHIPLATMRAAPTIGVSAGAAASVTPDGFELTHNAAADCVVTASAEL